MLFFYLRFLLLIIAIENAKNGKNLSYVPKSVNFDKNYVPKSVKNDCNFT